jgi:hypothetical protein
MSPITSVVVVVPNNEIARWQQSPAVLTALESDQPLAAAAAAAAAQPGQREKGAR